MTRSPLLAAGSAANASRRRPGSGRNPSSPTVSPAAKPASSKSRRVGFIAASSRDLERRRHGAQRGEAGQAFFALGLAGIPDRLIGRPAGSPEDGIPAPPTARPPTPPPAQPPP